MLGRPRLLEARNRFSAPGSGIWIVFRQQFRAAGPWRTLAWTALFFVVHQGLALGFQSMVMPLQEYASATPRFLVRLLTMGAVAGAVVALPTAAVLGALAPPPLSRLEATQSLLLTRLTPLDLCAGRLLAWLWPVISGLLASCALALAIQALWRPLLPGTADGFLEIGAAYATLLISAVGVGSTAFAFAQRAVPGRLVGRGLSVGLALSALALGGLLASDGIIKRMENPTGVIEALLVVNPAAVAASALRADILRLPWLYERTSAPEYPFVYPTPFQCCRLFACGAILSVWLSSIRMRKAYT